MADNVGISVDIDFEDIKAVQAKFKTLLDGLKNNKIDVDINIKDIGIQLSDIKKKLDKLGADIAFSQDKSNKDTVRIYKNTNDEIVQMLRERAKAIEDMGNKQSKVSWLENEKGNIKSATIEYTDGIGKIQREMYNLKMTSEETESAITQTFSMKNTGTKFIDNIDKAEKQQLKLNNSVKDFEIKLQRLEGRYGKAIPKDELQAFQTALNSLKTGGLDSIEQKTKEINQMFQKLTLSTQETSRSSMGMSGLLGSAFNNLPAFLLAGNLYSKAFSEIRNGITDIIDLDTAMTNLRKVTDETDASYANFLNTSYNTAISLGGSSKNIIEATSEFAKLGYSMQEASKLGENALIYQNVGDIQDITRASASMISTMTAFNIEAKDSLDIIDKFNKIGNEFSVSSEGIGLALQKSASALSNANNDINESIALIASANKIIQNPEEVGSALKTLSLRLRMVKDDSGELEANMRSLVKEIAGVDIMLDEDNFKSTYQILLEIGRVWDTLADKERALLGEKIAGKNRANVFFGIMENWKDLDKVAEASLNSQGSAMEEYGKYMESLEAKINIFQETLVKLFSTNIDNGFLGGIIEDGTGVINIIQSMTDGFGGLPTAIGLTTGALTAFNSKFRNSIFGENSTDMFKNIKSDFIDFNKEMAKSSDGAKNMGVSMTGYIGKLVATQAQTIATTVATVALQTAITMGLSIAITALIGVLSKGIDKLVNWKKHTQEAVDVSAQIISDLSSGISTIEELSDAYDTLSKKIDEVGGYHKLSAEEQSEYVNISNQLLEISPDLLHYYTESGERIVKESQDLPALIELKERELEIEKELLAINAGKLYDGGQKSLNDEKIKLEELRKEREEILAKIENPQNIKSPMIKVEDEVAVSHFKSLLKDLNKEINETELFIKKASNENAQHALTVLEASDAYKQLSPHIQQALSDLILFNSEDIAISGIDEMSNDIEEYADKLTSLFNKDIADNELQRSIDNLTKEFIKLMLGFGLTEEQALSLSSVLKSSAQKSTDDLADSVENLGRQYMLSAEELDQVTKTLKDSLSQVRTLEKALAELNDAHKLSDDTIASLIDRYPDLLYLRDDETALSQFLQEQIAEETRVYAESMDAKIENSESFYRTVISGNSDLVDSLNEYYGVDFNNFTTLAQAKGEVEASLISELGDMWAGYYRAIQKGNTNVEAQLEKQVMMAKREGYETESSKEAARVLEAVHKVGNLANVFEAFKPTFSGIGSQYKGSGSGSKSGSGSSSSKSDLPKYITQGYDDISKEILAKSDKLEREIAQANAKILNAQLLGNTEEELALQTQLEGMYNRRIELEKEKSVAIIGLRKKVSTELSKKNFDVLKGINLETITEKQLSDINRKLEVQIDKANKAKNDKLANSLKVQQDMINEHVKAILDANSNINSISLNVRNLENENIEKSIELLERKYELESATSAQKTKDLEYEQMLYEQDSEGYIDIERQKLDVIYGERQKAEDMYNILREKGYDSESDIVKKYHDLWYGYNVKIRQMQMETAKRNKDNELKNLKEKQAHTEQLISMTMDMLRSQYQEERELIEKNSRAKQDALNKELEGYKKIINERKKALQDEVKKEDYQTQLDQYNKELSDMKSQAALLGKDETAVVEYEKLLEDIVKKESELKKYQRDYNLGLQQESLDKELSQYEDKIKSEIDKLEDQKKDELSVIDRTLKNEVRLREEAIRLIERKNKNLFDQLNKWAEENGTKTKEEIEKAWNGAYDAISEYNNGQLDVLDTLTLIAEKIKEVENSSWTDWSYDGVDNNGPAPVSRPSNKHSEGNNSGSSDSNSKPDSGLSQKGKEQLNQQKYLHQQMLIAMETNNEGLKKWVREQRKKWGLNVTTGAIEKQFHTGINAGRIDGLKADEVVVKALNDEWFVTNGQMENLKKNLSNLSGGRGVGDIEISIDALMKDVKIDKSVNENELAKKLSDGIFKQVKETFKIYGLRK